MPPENCIDDWKDDYQAMCESMIYEPNPLPFDRLIERMRELETRFHSGMPGWRAFLKMRETAAENGLSDMTLDEINEEIRAAREERKK